MTPDAAAIAYRLVFDPAHHLVHVRLRLPAGITELMMAVWTPGSYMVREYARHVEAMRAHGDDGRPLRVIKVRKNRWQVERPPGGGACHVDYTVYGREMTVRTNWIDDSFALLNGAPTFVTPVGAAAAAHDVQVVLPAGWQQVVTALPPHPDGQPQHFRAAHFDQLVDAPLLCGSPQVETFAADGATVRLATVGGEGAFDGARAADEVRRLVACAARLWGGLPFAAYTFINLLTEGRGGLEHADSAVLMAGRHVQRSRAGHLGWLGLVAHEFFHAWNIKRLRPRELGPFDYEAEATTRSLWIAEGLTAYYDDLLVCRAGLCSAAEYVGRLGKNFEQLEGCYGRHVQALGDASFDAWIKHYRRDENTDNSAVSYYTKGALVGFLLDAHIRAHTDSGRSLDDVMRLAMARFSGARGYEEAEFRALCGEVAGAPLDSMLAAAVDGTEALDCGAALSALGLRQAAAAAEPGAWLGVTTRGEPARLLLAEVRRGTPAYEAGLQVDDEILAVDAWRVLPGRLAEHLAGRAPGEAVALLVSRRDRLVRLRAVLGPPPAPAGAWELDPAAPPAAVARRRTWLGDFGAPIG